MLQSTAFGPAIGGGRKWSKTEERFMKRHYGRYDSFWISRQLSRTDVAIKKRASRMGLRKARLRSVWLHHYGAPDAYSRMLRTKRSEGGR